MMNGNWIGNAPEFARSIGQVKRNIRMMPMTSECRLRNSVDRGMENSLQGKRPNVRGQARRAQHVRYGTKWRPPRCLHHASSRFVYRLSSYCIQRIGDRLILRGLVIPEVDGLAKLFRALCFWN